MNAQTILMVTAGSSPTSEESQRQTQFQSWGYTVTTIEDSDSQANFDTAVAAADLVYIPEDASASALGYKLRTATIGVISEEEQLDDEFGFFTSNGYEMSSGTFVKVTDNSHAITSGIGSGFQTIFSSSDIRIANSSTSAAGFQALIEEFGGDPVLGYIESGGTLANTYSSNSTASGRRVRLPWGGDSFSFSNLDSDGLSILQNALSWASSGSGGGGGGGSGGSTDLLYLSTLDSATLGGQTFEDDDVVSYDTGADSATLLFDGSSLFSTGEDIYGLHVLANGRILLSTYSSATLGGLTFQNEDIVEYDPSTDTATMFFDGSAIFSSDEAIDAVSLLENGNVVLSTTGSAAIGGLNFNDDDLVEYNPSSGVATMLFDGSTILTLTSGSDRDIDAAHVQSDGKIILSVVDNCSIGGLSFGDDDLVEYDPSSGTATLYFDGGNLFSSTSEDITAVSLSGGSTGLLAHWELNEGSGTTISDDSGNGHDGTFDDGTPTWTSGVRGGALEFDGSSDVETDVDFDPPEIGSIAFWVRPSGALSDSIVMGASGNYQIRTTSAGAISCDLNGSEAANTFFSSDDTLTVDRWTHVVAIYNTTNDTHQLYVNGELVASGAYVCGDEDAAPFTLGSRRGSTSWFSGSLDDVRIYGYEISEAEIAQLYGLVGHWKLEEASGTTAEDSSLYANDGTHNSGVTVGQPGPTSGILAAEYDGSNNFTDVPYGANWNPVDNEFSLATWVRIDVGSDSHGLIVWSDSASPYALTINSSNEVELLTNWGSVSGESGDFTHSSTGTLNVGQWHHVAVTYDGTTTRFYIDGVEDSTSTASVTIGTSTDKMQLGGDDGSSYDLTGAMYDARIYNRVITPEEIGDLALIVGATGLVGHWKLDETSGGMVADSSGYGWDGQNWNGVVQGVAGVRSYGASYDGINDGTVVGDYDEHDVTNAITVAAWVNLNQLTGDAQFLVAKGGSGAYRLRVNPSGNASFDLFGTSGQETSGTTVMPEGEWVHVVGTYDGSTTKVYLNGVLDGQESSTGSINVTDDDLTIGMRHDHNKHLDGSLDDIRIYDYALSEPEIAEVYGLVGHWKLDESSGSTASDSSLSGFDGTYQGSPLLGQAGILDTAVWHDGLDDGIEVSDQTAFQITEHVSVAAWVKFDDLDGLQRIGGRGSYDGYKLWKPSGSRKVAFECRGLSSNIEVQSSQDLVINRWYHVVGTYDGEYLRIFLNGEIDNEVAATGTITDGSDSVRFGRDSSATDPLHGTLDDARIYNRALSTWEVNKIYGRLAYWKLDETSGATALDSTERGNDATITGSPILGVDGTFTAKTGTAIELDGAAEYVATDKNLLDDLTEFGMAGWVRVDSLEADQSFFGQDDHIEFGIKNSSGQLRIWTDAGGAISATNQLPLGKWTHVAVTGDGSGLTMYVNGQEVASGGSSTASYGTSTSVFKLGEGVWSSTGDYLDGRLDDVQVFDRFLGPEEIRSIYKGGRPEGVRIIKWLEVR